jgi:hypothetical protein
MTNKIVKNLVESTAAVTHNIADSIIHAAHDFGKSISDIGKSPGDKAENFLKEKNISVTRENRHGKDCHNIVANSDGTFFTNNSIDFTRGLLNQVLFSNGGEERVANAMSEKKSPLEKIQNPHQKIGSVKAFQLSSTSNLNNA